MGAVVGIALFQGFGTGAHHVFGGVEIGFADFHVDDVLALGFEGAGFGEHLKGGFGAEVIHAAGKLHWRSPQAGFGDLGDIIAFCDAWRVGASRRQCGWKEGSACLDSG